MTDLTSQQRQLALHRMLVKGRKVLASELAKKFGCNERTIRRDLIKMRDESGLPIEFDSRDQTWRYIREVAEVPPMLVDTEDRQALLFTLRAAAQFEDTPVRQQVERLYENLLGTLPPEQVTRFKELMDCVHFTGPRLQAVKKEVWDVVLLAMEGRETMRIVYTDGYHGFTGERDIDPYGLLMRDRRWILVAYCHKRKAILTFSLNRISRAETTDEAFELPANFMERYLADDFEGLQSTGEKVRVRLRIAKDAPLYVRDRQWNDKETRTRSKDGNLIVTFKTAAMFAVEREVRAEGGWVEVLEPVDSRERLHNSGRAIANIHQE
ncbi:MAG: WYL domain-containing protein [Phycisphaerales bacterium]|nr:WYL domain-containing protein [Phycisphaerales bacterium]